MKWRVSILDRAQTHHLIDEIVVVVRQICVILVRTDGNLFCTTSILAPLFDGRQKAHELVMNHGRNSEIQGRTVSVALHKDVRMSIPPVHMDFMVGIASGTVKLISVMSVERASSGFHCVITRAWPGCGTVCFRLVTIASASKNNLLIRFRV